MRTTTTRALGAALLLATMTACGSTSGEGTASAPPSAGQTTARPRPEATATIPASVMKTAMVDDIDLPKWWVRDRESTRALGRAFDEERKERAKGDRPSGCAAYDQHRKSAPKVWKGYTAYRVFMFDPDRQSHYRADGPPQEGDARSGFVFVYVNQWRTEWQSILDLKTFHVQAACPRITFTPGKAPTPVTSISVQNLGDDRLGFSQPTQLFGQPVAIQTRAVRVGTVTVEVDSIVSSPELHKVGEDVLALQVKRVQDELRRQAAAPTARPTKSKVISSTTV